MSPSPRNDSLHSINAQVLNDIPGEIHLCPSWSSMKMFSVNDAVEELPTEYLNSINLSDLPSTGGKELREKQEDIRSILIYNYGCI
jgi:hypothetical protein